MSCPLRRPQGSGYQKPKDTALAAANETSLAALLAARKAQDTAAYAAYVDPVEPKPPAPRAPPTTGKASTTTTDAQGTKEGAAS